MLDGNDNIDKTLVEAERCANVYERHLPHLSDTLRSLIKIIKTYDKNQKALIRQMLKHKRVNKELKDMAIYMGKFLNGFEIDKVEAYMKERTR